MIRLLFISIISIIFGSGKISAETIRITNGEWEPFLSRYSYEYGLDSHIVTEAFKLEGVTVEWGFFPWKRSYQYAKDGRDWDASCCWWPDDGTRKDFLLSDEITQTSLVFFHLKSYPFQWHSFADLSGKTIGLTDEYHYDATFMEMIISEKLTVEVTTKDQFNFKKLLAGQIDIFPNDPNVGKAQIRNSLSAKEADLITHHEKAFGVSSLHLIISLKNKRNQYFLDKFNKGLKKLKVSGRYQQMIDDAKAGIYDKKIP